jgi:SAM-dependent methyltransferase
VTNEALESFFKEAVRAGAYGHEARLRRYMTFLFEGIDFAGKRVLDVGGGNGYLSLYAASRGAAEALCLEPALQGSRTPDQQIFERLKAALPVGDRVQMEGTPFERHDAGAARYDVLILHDSVNHLNERACAELHRDLTARQTYLALFQRLASLASPGAALVLSDCTCSNLFPLLGLRNPFVPAINWDIHQPPELWASLLQEAGFAEPWIRWSPVNRLGWIGRRFLANKVAAYFLTGHFCLRMRRA